MQFITIARLTFCCLILIYVHNFAFFSFQEALSLFDDVARIEDLYETIKEALSTLLHRKVSFRCIYMHIIQY